MINAASLVDADFLKVKNKPTNNAAPKKINDMYANNANSSWMLMFASTTP